MMCHHLNIHFQGQRVNVQVHYPATNHRAISSHAEDGVQYDRLPLFPVRLKYTNRVGSKHNYKVYLFSTVLYISVFKQDDWYAQLESHPLSGNDLLFSEAPNTRNIFVQTLHCVMAVVI